MLPLLKDLLDKLPNLVKCVFWMAVTIIVFYVVIKLNNPF